VGKVRIEATLQMMVGLPSETRDDALRTIDFLIRHRDFTTDLTYNTYLRDSGMRVYLDPGNMG
jgi:radical SAM superfamily enzyme YgiQ (UPF0313 family)